MIRYQSFFAVAAGGAIGSLVRWGTLEIITGDIDVIGAEAVANRAVLATLAINVLGSLLLGALIAHQRTMASTLYLAAGTGFAGGLTTFSTFAVAVAERLDSGEFLAALSNGLGTAIATLLAAGVGYRLGLLTR